MKKNTKQADVWSGKFGKEYTKRNTMSVEEMDKLYIKNFGISRTEMNRLFLQEFDKKTSILEVGANVGNQLLLLRDSGYKNLTGLELQEHAVKQAKKRIPEATIAQGSALDLPFIDNSFDLVFTSGVLIHIAPGDISEALKEIHRCSKRYIWGFEYFSENYTKISYRGNSDLLWKADFAKMYLDSFKDLRLIKEKRFAYLDGSKNTDSMFLLEKIKPA